MKTNLFFAAFAALFFASPALQAAEDSFPIPDQNIEVVWLDELDLSQTVTGYGETRSRRTTDNHELEIDGRRYERGIGWHAPGLIAVRLPECPTRFISDFGLADEVNERGHMNFRVFADETRPLLQGARLTSWELMNAGIDVTLICDNMASIVMKNGWVQYCFTGCDRVAANGDTANKIGTSGVAILAKHYGIPFYILGPSSTVDLNTPTGADIVIEERDPDEIREKWYAEPMAPEGVKCYNPAFDVTDHELIACIIIENGICRPPYTKSLKKLFE